MWVHVCAHSLRAFLPFRRSILASSLLYSHRQKGKVRREIAARRKKESPSSSAVKKYPRFHSEDAAANGPPLPPLHSHCSSHWPAGQLTPALANTSNPMNTESQWKPAQPDPLTVTRPAAWSCTVPPGRSAMISLVSLGRTDHAASPQHKPESKPQCFAKLNHDLGLLSAGVRVRTA